MVGTRMRWLVSNNSIAMPATEVSVVSVLVLHVLLISLLTAFGYPP